MSIGDQDLTDLLRRASDAVYDVTCAICQVSYGHRVGCKNEDLAKQLNDAADMISENKTKKGGSAEPL